ncbi:hypothetical protein VCHENC02_0852A, partial [Vibrio harveyi]
MATIHNEVSSPVDT